MSCSVAPPQGQAGNSPPYPLQSPIGHSVRSMQIRGAFHVQKKWEYLSLQNLLPRFTYTDATVDVLWSYDYEKEGVVDVVEGVRYFGRPSVRLWDTLGSFSPGIGPSKDYIFLFFF